MEQLGITLYVDHGMVYHILNESTQSIASLQPEYATNANDTAIEVYQATVFLIGSDCSRFGKLIEELHNDYTMGVEKYLKTLQEAYHILKHYKFDARNCLSICLSVGPASETPKLIHYRAVLFHTPDSGLTDL